MRVTKKEILDVADKYQQTSKAKFVGVLAFDFLAGARWMEKKLNRR